MDITCKHVKGDHAFQIMRGHILIIKFIIRLWS